MMFADRYEEAGYWDQRRAGGMAANPFGPRSFGGHRPVEEAAWYRGQQMALRRHITPILPHADGLLL